MTDTVLLKQRISDSGYKLHYIAEKIGLSRAGLYKKINNQSEFTTGEVEMLCEILGIETLEERHRIFFAKQVDLISTMG